jgi:hypothetical protein
MWTPAGSRVPAERVYYDVEVRLRKAKKWRPAARFGTSANPSGWPPRSQSLVN